MTTQDPSAPAATEAPATPPIVGEMPGPDIVAEAKPADPAPDIGALLKRAEDEAAELKDAWLRARADIENVRRQAANDLARAHKYAIERFAEDLLAGQGCARIDLGRGQRRTRCASGRRRADAEATRCRVREGADHARSTQPARSSTRTSTRR